MTSFRLLPTAALAALALFATTASYAQGLGGMLNQAKAKAKVNQATSAGARPGRAATAAATQATQATDYQVPRNLSQDPSIEEMEEYARGMLADPRPAGRDCDDDNCVYRRLTIDQGYPIKFTWDQAAVVNFKQTHTGLFPYIRDLSGDFVQNINNDVSIYHVPLMKVLHKVKEIHLTSKPKLVNTGEPGQDNNWWFSFNPATGVLTAAMCTGKGPNSLSMGHSPLVQWVIRYVH